MIKNVDYIIAGQGLAGSVLARELIKRNKKVVIFDPGFSNATKVASGIINPITGRNYVKTWMADEIIPFAVNFYRDMEKEFQKSFLKEIPVYKLFYSEGNINDWSLRAGSREYNSYLKNEIPVKLDADKITNFYGAFEITGTYSLNTTSFLEVFLFYLKEKEMFVEEELNYDLIEFDNNKIKYKDYKAGKIIFCEGYKGMFNPYFKYLPFNPAKGECLHVAIDNFYDDRIINGNYFTMPMGENKYYLGSTNFWDFNDDLPSEKGKKELTKGLKTMTALPFSIDSHYAGIRPTVKDRKPFLGLHPHFPQLGIFNGLGTKGISLAPYFASHFSDFILNNTPLLKEVDIKRV